MATVSDRIFCKVKDCSGLVYGYLGHVNGMGLCKKHFDALKVAVKAGKFVTIEGRPVFIGGPGGGGGGAAAGGGLGDVEWAKSGIKPHLRLDADVNGNAVSVRSFPGYVSYEDEQGKTVYTTGGHILADITMSDGSEHRVDDYSSVKDSEDWDYRMARAASFAANMVLRLEGGERLPYSRD